MQRAPVRRLSEGSLDAHREVLLFVMDCAQSEMQELHWEGPAMFKKAAVAAAVAGGLVLADASLAVADPGGRSVQVNDARGLCSTASNVAQSRANFCVGRIDVIGPVLSGPTPPLLAGILRVL